ncbi:hypothetical protein U1Q18_035775 [Sarracenia purpurea var. burkii]
MRLWKCVLADCRWLTPRCRLEPTPAAMECVVDPPIIGIFNFAYGGFPFFFSIPLLAIFCGIKRETGKSDGQLWVGDYELGLQKNITAAA